ncbi:MAG TPA: phenylalanine--tRNA ligase subunit beta [Polyangiaceae bacterium]
MKVPLSWLQEFFADPLDVREVAEKLTLSGIEVEQVQGIGALDPLVVAGEISAVEPVAKFPGVNVLTVMADRRRTIVSTVAGLTPGRTVAVALPGATLFDALELGLLDVQETESYGQRSEGILVHAWNLGLGPDRDRPVELVSARPGQSAAEALVNSKLGAADCVLWLAILPNIARCQALVGVAREVAALLGKSLRERVAPPPLHAAGALAPSITAKDACTVLSVTLLENVRVAESPEWLRRRLVLAGMTPINNVVDASNYVMLELGQPTHPYDADRLPSLDLGVRRARAGDRLLTLQQAEGEEPMELPAGVPLIVSNDEPVAMAGVLGGRPSSISAETSRVLLEAAAFEYVAIRRSQQVAKVYSEASARFSRGVNPELPVLAARHFLEVLRETSPDVAVRSFGEASLGVPPPRRIELTVQEIEASLGSAVPLEEAAEALGRLNLGVDAEPSTGRLSVTVGNARADITLPCDLIEEIARIRGYERIPETMPLEPIPERMHDDHRAREGLRDALVRAGLQEVISYTMSGPDLEARLYAGHPNAVAPRAPHVLNPVSVERSLLRTSLLPALLQIAAANLRHTPGCRLFEIGPVFAAKDEPGALPAELERVGILLAGRVAEPTLHDREPRPADFFDLRAVLGQVLSDLGIEEGVELQAFDGAPYRPGAAACLRIAGEWIGTLGAVHPRVLAKFELEGHVAIVAELSVEALLARRPARRAYREYDRLPSVELDIAMVLDRSIAAATVRQVARDVGGAWLREVEAFDEFRGDRFGADKKALAIRLRLNAGERTLEMSEALEVRARVARALENTLRAQIRE